MKSNNRSRGTGVRRGMGQGIRLRRSAVLVLAAVSWVAAATMGAGAGGSKTEWSKTTKIAPGVFYTKTVDKTGPYRIFVLRINPSKPSTIDTVLATDKLPGLERTSSMAARSGAIAAINGDYASFTGRPVYTFARDGSLDQTPTSWGRNFSMTTTETASYIGHPATSASMFDPATGISYDINRVNEGEPGLNKIAMYTPSGGTDGKPPPDACSARLFPVEAPRLRESAPGAESLHYVDSVVCKSAPMPRQGGVVVATPAAGGKATAISSLVIGQQLSIGWSLGWTGVFDTIGGNPTLIENGIIQTDNVTGTDSFHMRHPRTGVGTTATGKVLFVAVDGRQPGYSIGMTLERFAQLFEDLGATWALNLDGGGSTTFVVNGDIKNRPSSGGVERPVSSALVLLPGADPGELADFDGSKVSTRSVWRRISADPASTGGMADWLRGEGRALSPSLARAAHDFANR
jgi:exopolysaccharide biosynthesis protein